MDIFKNGLITALNKNGLNLSVEGFINNLFKS